MGNDPLAEFRRERSQRNGIDLGQGSRADKPDQAVEPLTEHQALRLAIDALNQIPNHAIKGEYQHTYALLPILEQTYERAETPHLNYLRDAFKEPAPEQKSHEIDIEER